MLSGSIRAAGLEGVFEHVLTTDQVKTYKPDPRAYQLDIDALGLPREQILFVAFAGLGRGRSGIQQLPDLSGQPSRAAAR